MNHAVKPQGKPFIGGAAATFFLLLLALVFISSDGQAAQSQYENNYGQCQGACNGDPGERPDLRLYKDRIYWASFSDYQKRRLSVDYRVKNLGPGILYRVDLFKAEATDGVKNKTRPLPGLACSLAANQTAAFTLKYEVPAGVSRFATTNFVKAKNSCNRELMYPDQPGQN